MLDFLLRTWLGNTARRHVFDAASQAAFAHLNQAAQGTDEQSGNPPRRDRPCDVGLVFAQPLCAGSFEDRLDGVLATHTGGLKFCQGGLRGRHVVHVAASAGPAAAQQAAELLIAGHRPQWIISAGLASGLQPQLQRGDFLMATEVCNDQQHSLAIDLQMPPGDPSRSPRVHAGKLLSTDQPVRRAAEKESLGRASTRALAADSESFAVAQVCQAREDAIPGVTDHQRCAARRAAARDRASRPQEEPCCALGAAPGRCRQSSFQREGPARAQGAGACSMPTGWRSSWKA